MKHLALTLSLFVGFAAFAQNQTLKVRPNTTQNQGGSQSTLSPWQNSAQNSEKQQEPKSNNYTMIAYYGNRNCTGNPSQLIPIGLKNFDCTKMDGISGSESYKIVGEVECVNQQTSAQATCLQFNPR